MKRALAAVLLGACWNTPVLPTTSGPVPGTIWITPAQPWHVSQPPSTILADGATALVAGRHGWIARLDLATGLTVQERRLGTLEITDLAKLPDGRLVAVGTDHGRATAVVVDAGSFAPRPIALGALQEKGGAIAGVAVLADGGVVIAGQGLPLAVYDPGTWEIRTVIDAERNWSRLQVVGDTLVALRTGTATRFDLRTGTRTKLGTATNLAVSTGPLALRVYEKSEWFTDVWTGDTKVRIPMARSPFAIDRDGTRLAMLRGSTVEIVALPDATVSARFDLGASGAGTPAMLVFDGARLIIGIDSVIRVIDLAAKTVTPEGLPPHGTAAQLAVHADGSVLAIGAQVWRLAAGTVTATAPLDGHEALTLAPGEVLRYATLDERGDPDRPMITLHALDARAPIASWRLPQPVLQGWVGRTGAAAFDVLSGDDGAAGIVKTDGASQVSVASLRSNANVRDIDVDGGLALVGITGTVYMMRLADGQLMTPTLRAPRCAEWGTAGLERGGPRVYTADGRDLVVWHRATGAILGTARFAEEVSRVVFVPGRDDVLVGLETGLVLWSPRAVEARPIALPSWYIADVSPDGRRLALGFGDGRIALVDLDVLRAALPLATVTPAPVPDTCPSTSPLEVPDPEVEDPELDWDEGD